MACSRIAVPLAVLGLASALLASPAMASAPGQYVDASIGETPNAVAVADNGGWFTVHAFPIALLANPADAFRLDEVNGVAVVFAKAEGTRCARSWRILPEVGTAIEAIGDDVAALRSALVV